MKQSQAQRRAINAVLTVLAASCGTDGVSLNVSQELEGILPNNLLKYQFSAYNQTLLNGMISKRWPVFPGTKLLHPLQFDRKDLALLGLICMTGSEGGVTYVTSIDSQVGNDWFLGTQPIWVGGQGLILEGVSVHPYLLQSVRYKEWYDLYFSELCPLVSDVTDGTAIVHVGNRPCGSGGALRVELEGLLRTAGVNEAIQRHAKALLRELDKRQMT